MTLVSHNESFSKIKAFIRQSHYIGGNIEVLALYSH